LNRYDFLVVGGGPVGCRAAYKLAKAGHQVAVLEKSPSIGGPVCCTGIVSRECINRFSIPPELVLEELASASIFSPSGKLLRLERSETQAAVIDRGAYNAYMAGQAQDEGVDYLMGHHVTHIQANPDKVVITVDFSGKVLTFEAHAILLACGFGSRLPEKAGFGKCRDWAAGAQVEVEANDLSEVEIYLGRDIAPGFFGWLVPSGGSAGLAGLMAKQEADSRMERFISLLKSKGRISAVRGNPSYRGITLRPPQRTYSHRMVVVGDAAGQVKPLTGGGIFLGLLSADISADILHVALEERDFSPGRLSLYSKEWRRLFGKELKLGHLAHRLYGRMGDEQIEWLMALAEKKRLPAKLSASPAIGFDWHGSAMLQVVKQVMWPFTKSWPSSSSDDSPVEVRSHVR
jgi:digeranylgeranylglycerophospholipid reductase